MNNLKFAALSLLIYGCAPAQSEVNSSSANTCDVADLEEVFRDPMRYAGMHFCGEVAAYPEGLTIKMFPLGYRSPDNQNHTVLLAESDSEELLRLDNPSQPFRVYLRGRLEPMEECFETPLPPNHMCVPYARPIFIYVSEARRVSAIGLLRQEYISDTQVKLEI